MKLTHWEYTFCLHTCNLGDGYRTGTNPFTGETVYFPVDDGLTADEWHTVQNVFEEHGIEGPERGEGYAVYGPDGDSLRFQCSDLSVAPLTGMGVEIVVRRLSDSLLGIILEVAEAGNLALTSAVGDCVRTVRATPSRKMLTRWPDAKPLVGLDDFRSWIEETIGGSQVSDVTQFRRH